MSYLPSIIIHHHCNDEPLSILEQWLLDNKIEVVGKLNNNPNFSFFNKEGESIKIKTIREIINQLAFSNYNQQTRYLVLLNFHLTTIPAQNALLKTLEEPPSNTHIILLTTNLHSLLPTITSRCQIIKVNKQSNNNFQAIQDIYQQLLKSKHYQCIELAEKYKEKERAVKFCEQLLLYLQNNLDKTNDQPNNSKIVLKTLNLIKQNINTRLALENCFFSLIKN